MKYLRDNEDNSAYMPPDEFKTRRQIRNVVKTKQESKPDQQLNFIKFQKKQESEEGHGGARFKKAAHIIQDIITFEHFSSNHEIDWVQCKEAGVVFWTNKNTGEVSTVCPWVSGKDGRCCSTSEAARRTSASEARRTSVSEAARRTSMTAGYHPERTGEETRRISISAGGNRGSERYEVGSLRRSRIRTDSGGSPRSLHASTTAGSPSQTARKVNLAKEATTNTSNKRLSHSQNPNSMKRTSITEEGAGEVELGTGSLVYDGTEIDKLFALLDHGK